jgi:hypothetical protein
MQGIFNMTLDSHLFYSRERLLATGGRFTATCSVAENRYAAALPSRR